MRDRIESALRGSKADYTEIRIEQREATMVAFRGRNLETASAVVDTGGIVRCLCRNNGWVVVTFNSLEDLAGRGEQATRCARAAHSEQPIELAPVPAAKERITDVEVADERTVTFRFASAYPEQLADAVEAIKENCMLRARLARLESDQTTRELDELKRQNDELKQRIRTILEQRIHR